MADKKSLPFAILKILTEYTDESHLLSTTEIKTILEKEYGLQLERRTLYATVELLKQFGYKIGTWHENGIGYYLKEHQFSLIEAFFLCDEIQQCNSLTMKRKKMLKNKILSTLSKYQVKEYMEESAALKTDLPA